MRLKGSYQNHNVNHREVNGCLFVFNSRLTFDFPTHTHVDIAIRCCIALNPHRRSGSGKKRPCVKEWVADKFINRLIVLRK